MCIRDSDELVFQIDLGAGQTRMVTIAYGEQAAIQRLRGKYPPRTAMQFATRYEGLGWESEDIAWRIYFDKRNAIDIYGKRRPGLYLDVFAAPQYVYHLESPLGRDIFKVDPTLGVALPLTMAATEPTPSVGSTLKMSRPSGLSRWYTYCGAAKTSRYRPGRRLP